MCYKRYGIIARLNFLNNCVCLQMYGLAPVEHTKNLTMLTPILVAGRPQRPTTSDDATSHDGIREAQIITVGHGLMVVCLRDNPFAAAC